MGSEKNEKVNYIFANDDDDGRFVGNGRSPNPGAG